MSSFKNCDSRCVISPPISPLLRTLKEERCKLMTKRADNKRIKVILLTSSYPSSSGVVNRSFMTDFAESVSKKGIRVFVICPHQPNLSFREEQENITIIRFPYWFTASEQKLGGAGGIVPSMSQSLLAVIQLIPFCICQLMVTLRTIKEENIDLIHSHWVIPQGFVGALVRFITGIPHVVSIHGTDIHLIHSYRITHPFMNMVARCTNCITTNSSHTNQLLMDVISKKNINSSIIPMGINLDQFHSVISSINKKEITILFVGRLIDWKGVCHLITAMKTVISRFHNAKLKIIGTGPEREQLEKLTRSINISSQVQFFHNVERKQLLLHYKDADLFVLPSITTNGQTEGLGVVLLEAMASGVPVIGSNTGGIPDIITDGVNGLLVPPGDPNALAAAMIRILEDPELAERFREAGLETVKKRFSWDRIVDQFIHVYATVIKSEDQDY